MLRSIVLVLLVLVGCDQPLPRVISGSTLPTCGETALVISPAAAVGSSATWNGAVWAFGTDYGAVRYPVPVQSGDVILEWALYVRRTTAGAFTAARLFRMDTGSTVNTNVGPVGEASGEGPGTVPIGAHVPPEVVTDDASYSLLAEGGGPGGGGDAVTTAVVYVQRPTIGCALPL